MKIRETSTADINWLSEIVKTSYQTVADQLGLNASNCPKHPSNCTDEWINSDLERGVTYFLLESEDQKIGCAALEIANEEMCYLERLAILPEHRNNGYGKILVNHIFDKAKDHGCKKISIGIIAQQIDLKNWYSKFGFKEGITKSFDHLPFDVTFMDRSLF